jgi:hypothetical protein
VRILLESFADVRQQEIDSLIGVANSASGGARSWAGKAPRCPADALRGLGDGIRALTCL